MAHRQRPPPPQQFKDITVAFSTYERLQRYYNYGETYQIVLKNKSSLKIRTCLREYQYCQKSDLVL
ncbi:MAG: hypothetical protein WBP64_20480 [Nitrososphaeraceae archaeon]